LFRVAPAMAGRVRRRGDRGPSNRSDSGDTGDRNVSHLPGRCFARERAFSKRLEERLVVRALEEAVRPGHGARAYRAAATFAGGGPDLARAVRPGTHCAAGACRAAGTHAPRPRSDLWAGP